MLSILNRSLLLALLLVTTACTSTPDQESTGELFDNSLITAKIKAKLFDDPVTSGFRIKVDTFKGVVQLSGFVYTNDERKRAVRIASQVEGVIKIENDLIVTPAK